MWNIYATCAVVGGTLLACQFLLALVGVGTDHLDLAGHHGDVSSDSSGHGHGLGLIFGLLTFRSLVAGLTFFGLAGLGTAQRQLAQSLAISSGTGLLAVALVGGLMRALYNARADGTVQIDKAVGRPGTVYLAVPPSGSGLGKVTLTLQNRTVECQAVTFQGELPTGTKVVVMRVVGPDTVEVAAAPECGRMVHV